MGGGMILNKEAIVFLQFTGVGSKSTYLMKSPFMRSDSMSKGPRQLKEGSNGNGIHHGPLISSTILGASGNQCHVFFDMS